jgi:AcrR family transcriptional regulator
MNDKFWDLRKEKQDRIINASLKIFASCGYKRASTDEIVKEAGISKGLLFHYFISKQGLYTFIYEYSAQYMELEYMRCIGESECDFFVLQQQLERAKLQIMRNYPCMNQFLNSAFLEEDKDILNEVAENMDRYSACLKNIYAKADLSLFKPEVNPSQVLKVVLFTVDGLRREQFEAGRYDPDALYQETMEILEMLRTNLYIQ